MLLLLFALLLINPPFRKKFLRPQFVGICAFFSPDYQGGEEAGFRHIKTVAAPPGWSDCSSGWSSSAPHCPNCLHLFSRDFTRQKFQPGSIINSSPAAWRPKYKGQTSLLDNRNSLITAKAGFILEFTANHCLRHK